MRHSAEQDADGIGPESEFRSDAVPVRRLEPANPALVRRRRPESSQVLSGGALVVLGIAFLKIVAAAGAQFAGPLTEAAGGSIGIAFVSLQLLTFGFGGAWLLVAHSGDARTASLGAMFVVTASAFAAGLYGDIARSIPVLDWLAPWYPDAFLPFFFSTFVAHFPRRRSVSHGLRPIRVIRVASLITGCTLFSANGLAGWLPHLQTSPVVQLFLRRSAAGTVYWTATFVLLAAAMPLLMRGLHALNADEQRRVRWFVLAFLAGFGPFVIAVVLMARASWAPVIMRPWIRSALEILLASVPITTAYAALVWRVLPIKVVVRTAIQYALARSTVLASMMLPIGLLIILAHRHRHDTVEAFVTGATFPVIAAMCASIVVALARSRILRSIDRAFFHDAYDGQTVLMQLNGALRIASHDELSSVLTGAIERTFAPEFADVLGRDPERQVFVTSTGRLPALPADGVLLELLADVSRPLEVEVDAVRSPLRWLPSGERQWLVDQRVRLLAPVVASDGTMAAVIVLGDRKSELPYGAGDRHLIAGMAEITALALERMEMSSMTARPDPLHERSHPGLVATSEGAAECPQCCAIEPRKQSSCPRCACALQPAHVPYVLFGRLQFEARIGTGAMGVVYRARDLMLHRVVAVKALPGTSPEQIQRFRLEARTMAAVSHPHLAAIYSVESWRGRPLLVCEFLSMGTLADRLARGTLPLAQVLSLGVALANALAAIHDAGFVHRDVKPANIGYASPKHPKLMDLGIAQAVFPPFAPRQAFATRNFEGIRIAGTQALAGTPLYLSPEAIAGELPTAAFDLWSLNVLLLEAVTGRHPFRERTTEGTLSVIREATYERVRATLVDVDPRLRTYFEAALSPKVTSRPASARKVARSMKALAGVLCAR